MIAPNNMKPHHTGGFTFIEFLVVVTFAFIIISFVLPPHG